LAEYLLRVGGAIPPPVPPAGRAGRSATSLAAGLGSAPTTMVAWAWPCASSVASPAMEPPWPAMAVAGWTTASACAAGPV